jgi:hypothetical protein
MKRLLALVALAILFSGCATAPYSFNVQNLDMAKKKIDAQVVWLSVDKTTPGEAKGDLDLLNDYVLSAWTRSILVGLNKTLTFRDESPKKVSIVVTVLKFHVPHAALSYKTIIIAKYEIIDRGKNEVIFSSVIDSEGTTPLDHSFMPEKRQRESINLAVRENISKFFKALEKLSI